MAETFKAAGLKNRERCPDKRVAALTTIAHPIPLAVAEPSSDATDDIFSRKKEILDPFKIGRAHV